MASQGTWAYLEGKWEPTDSRANVDLMLLRRMGEKKDSLEGQHT